MADETQGSNPEGGAPEPAPAESPAAETKAGEVTTPEAAQAPTEPQPPVKKQPGPGYFARKRIEEREKKTRDQELEAMKQKLAQLEQANVRPPAPEYEQPSEPSQPVTTAAPSEGKIRELIRNETIELQRNQYNEQQELVADDWLSSQKHVEDPKFREGVDKYLTYLREQEQIKGFKSDPVLLTKKAYAEVAEYFGVQPSAEGVVDAQARASAPAPSPGAPAGGSAAPEKVSAKEISDQMMKAYKSRDGEAFKKLEAKRAKALEEGRLIP